MSDEWQAECQSVAIWELAWSATSSPLQVGTASLASSQGNYQLEIINQSAPVAPQATALIRLIGLNIDHLRDRVTSIRKEKRRGMAT